MTAMGEGRRRGGLELYVVVDGGTLQRARYSPMRLFRQRSWNHLWRHTEAV